MILNEKQNKNHSTYSGNQRAYGRTFYSHFRESTIPKNEKIVYNDVQNI